MSVNTKTQNVKRKRWSPKQAVLEMITEDINYALQHISDDILKAKLREAYQEILKGSKIHDVRRRRKHLWHAVSLIDEVANKISNESVKVRLWSASSDVVNVLI
ncbi:MAG: hypothetical protein JHC26_09695 [Thermofilum sp.]|jgi:formamidopyrimidine-DNA glycosylase|uniref:hypothetical protein n=1 Tax=Thermofilum sp. TaxID=1961369 RepID=UPI002587CDFA|nr:hypothetical protein [Thermofilum sp.]MCI4409354.1 hypothetical protein [Thermofilum sp.]